MRDFKPGDRVILIRLEGLRYHKNHPPGTMGVCTAVDQKIIGDADLYALVRMDGDSEDSGHTQCALRKIEPYDGNKKLDNWDECPWKPGLKRKELENGDVEYTKSSGEK